PELWLGRIHPGDVDAIRAALDSLEPNQEKRLAYRFRDANDRYRWTGYTCGISGDCVTGIVADLTHLRSQEYANRIHLAGRESLSRLIESSDLNRSINDFLHILGVGLVVDRARLVRFRTDGRAFITHEWVKHKEQASSEVPEAVDPDAVHWSKAQLELNNHIVIESCKDPKLPESVVRTLSNNNVGAILAVPAVINGVVEAMACFDVPNERTWLPMEIEEATVVLNGYARAVERRIDDRRSAAEEFELRRSEEQFRLITSHSPVVLFGIDAQGIFTLSEGQGLGIMGAEGGSVVGKSVYHIYRNYPEVLRHVNKALGGVESHGRFEIGHHVIEGWFTPVLDEDHLVVGVSGVAVDITLRHELEKQQTIMMSELDHRVKNNIASVMSLVMLSRQNAASIDEFATALDGRLNALAIAHSSLAKTHWSGAELGEILRLTLQPYMDGKDDRIQIHGDELQLPGTYARPMCMVIHELATNAMKYGSLSREEGTVIIAFDASEALLCRFSWTERGGPAIESDIVEGTGTSLLEGLVSHELHGTIVRTYGREGFQCEIKIPVQVEH
ncbi:MAG: hypothetical protein MK073_03445, partial [Phycisphaerales bacterium]|nr:hypothetical protein [Phycisphaerales bacterium]